MPTSPRPWATENLLEFKASANLRKAARSITRGCRRRAASTAFQRSAGNMAGRSLRLGIWRKPPFRPRLFTGSPQETWGRLDQARQSARRPLATRPRPLVCVGDSPRRAEATALPVGRGAVGSLGGTAPIPSEQRVRFMVFPGASWCGSLQAFGSGGRLSAATQSGVAATKHIAPASQSRLW